MPNLNVDVSVLQTYELGKVVIDAGQCLSQLKVGSMSSGIATGSGLARIELT
jgi:hypothetical protein